MLSARRKADGGVVEGHGEMRRKCSGAADGEDSRCHCCV
jgi:hypothetical protein